MWSFSAWRRKRTLARYPITPQQWQAVRERLPMLDGITDEEDRWLREACILFLLDKHLTCLPGVEPDDEQRLLLAAQAQLPLLHLGELNWYQGFHEIILYPDDFKSPQRHRDASGVEHVWDGEHSGEAWQQGPIILAWSGVLASGGWEAYNLVIQNYPKGDQVAWAYFKRGQVQSRLGQTANARVSFEAVVKQFPDTEPAIMALSRLQSLDSTPPPAPARGK